MQGEKRVFPTEDSWAVLGLARFLLASVVVAGHLASLSHTESLKKGLVYIGLWLNQGSAVFGFLIVSGYAIAASLEKDLQDFLKRRFVRIYPLYVLVLLFAYAVGYALRPSMTLNEGTVIYPMSFGNMVATLFMLQTFLIQPMPIVGPLWSLAIEWWLYMLAPLLRKIASIFLGLLIVASLAYNIRRAPPDVSHLEHGRAFLSVAWYWFIGFFYFRYRRTWLGYAVLFIPVVAAYWSGIFVGRAVVIGIIAVACSENIPIGLRLKKIFDALGDISYPLYLFHIPLMVAAQLYGVKGNVPLYVLMFAVSCLVHYGFEIPVKRVLRRAIFRSRF